MNRPLILTDPERNFLLHWTHEASDLTVGPTFIWCINNRINHAYGPYPLAELFWDEQRQAGRTFWTGDRPPVPFVVPWDDADHFWERADAALTQIPRLQGDPRFTRAAFPWPVKGTLNPEEANFLRAYYAEMVRSGSGEQIDLVREHGLRDSQLIPFFGVLDGLDRPVVAPVVYPWKDFSARCDEILNPSHDDPTTP